MIFANFMQFTEKNKTENAFQCMTAIKFQKLNQDIDNQTSAFTI